MSVILLKKTSFRKRVGNVFFVGPISLFFDFIEKVPFLQCLLVGVSANLFSSILFLQIFSFNINDLITGTFCILYIKQGDFN